VKRKLKCEFKRTNNDGAPLAGGSEMDYLGAKSEEYK